MRADPCRDRRRRRAVGGGAAGSAKRRHACIASSPIMRSSGRPTRPRAGFRRRALRRLLPGRALAGLLCLGLPARRHRQHRDGLRPQGLRAAQLGRRLRRRPGWTGRETIRREGAPIPLKPLKRWDNGRDVVLAGDAAGIVAPASGEGIYYAMVGGRFAADAVESVPGDRRRRARCARARKRFMKDARAGVLDSRHDAVVLVLQRQAARAVRQHLPRPRCAEADLGCLHEQGTGARQTGWRMSGSSSRIWRTCWVSFLHDITISIRGDEHGTRGPRASHQGNGSGAGGGAGLLSLRRHRRPGGNEAGAAGQRHRSSGGGVLVFGDRGTGKSTAMRALAALLPPMRPWRGAAITAILPAAALCPECRAKRAAAELRSCPRADPGRRSAAGRDGGPRRRRARSGAGADPGEKAFEPGLLARAHRGFLYIDEVNLLEDHLVDLLLDVAASGENVVEREGMSIRHAARFVLVGSGNPEEGELRPQLLDRFGLSVEVKTPDRPGRPDRGGPPPRQLRARSRRLRGALEAGGSYACAARSRPRGCGCRRSPFRMPRSSGRRVCAWRWAPMGCGEN